MHKFYSILLLCITGMFTQAQDILLNASFADKGIYSKSPDQKGNVLSERAVAVVELPDGRMITAIEINATTRLTCYHPNGTQDKFFGNDGFSGPLPAVQAHLVRSAGKIFLVGLQAGAGTRFLMASFTENGVLDTGFGSNGVRIIPTGMQYNELMDVLLQPDGKFLLSGRQATNNQPQQGFVTRLLPDGTPDGSFFGSGRINLSYQGITAIPSIALSGQKIIAGATLYGGTGSDFGVVQFLENGTVDQSFGTIGLKRIGISNADLLKGISVQKDGKIIIAGETGENAWTKANFTVIRLLPDGELDHAYNQTGVSFVNFGDNAHQLHGVLTDAEDRVVLAGSMQGFGQPVVFARLTIDGQPDNSFAFGGRVVLSPNAAGRSLQDFKETANGFLVAAGLSFQYSLPNANPDLMLVRLQPNGMPDDQFSSTGILTGHLPARLSFFDQLRFFKDNRIMFRYNGRGDSVTLGLLCLLPDGKPDLSFGEAGLLNTTAYHFGILPDQRIVTLEPADPGGSSGQGVLMKRYTSKGKPDLSFGDKGVLKLALPERSNLNSLTIHPTGGLYVVANFINEDWQQQSYLTRLDANGEVDKTFGTNGMVLFNALQNEYADQAIIQPDGKILVKGVVTNASEFIVHFFIRRFSADGKVDESFAGNGTIRSVSGTYNYANLVLVQPDGKLLIGSVMSTNNQQYQNVIRRYNQNGTPDAGFGTNGVVNVANVTIASLANNKILLANRVASENGNGTDAALFLLNEDGTVDRSFGKSGAKVFMLSEEDDSFSWISLHDDKAYITGGRNIGLDQDAVLASFRILYEPSPDAAVSDFTLVDATTNKEVKTLTEGSVIDLAEFGDAKLNIRATTRPGKVGSVVFELQGPQPAKNTENILPYALFGDNNKGGYYGAILPVGNYTLIATPFSEIKGGGKYGIPLTVNFRVINSASVSTFTLVNADNRKDILTIKDGDTLNLAMLPSSNLNIRATTNPGKVGSVVLNLEGPLSAQQTENLLPYALFGDDNKGGYHGAALPAGTYTLTATPFSETKGGGAKGLTRTIKFYVLNQEVQSFTLVNAKTGKDITLLRTGDVIDLASLPTTGINIRANTEPGMVGSVAFALSGAQARMHTENLVPYALFAKTGKNYNSWMPATGTYLLTATPYDGKMGSGQKGRGYTVIFSVVNNAITNRLPATKAESTRSDLEKEQTMISARPNPFSSTSNISFSIQNSGYAVVGMYDIRGAEVVRLYQGRAEAGREYRTTVEANGLPAGLYVLRLTTGTDVKTLKIILIR